MALEVVCFSKSGLLGWLSIRSIFHATADRANIAIARGVGGLRVETRGRGSYLRKFFI